MLSIMDEYKTVVTNSIFLKYVRKVFNLNFLKLLD